MALTNERPTEAELPNVRPPSTIYAGNNRNSHPRSVVGKMTGVLLQPATFYRTMPANTSRHYLWIALLILVLISASAVQSTSGSQTGLPSGNVPSFDPSLGGAGGGGGGSSAPIAPGISPNAGESFGGGRPGSVPPDGGQLPPTEPTAPAVPISETWTTVLLACAGMIAIWLTQTVLLSEVSLFNASAPNWGRNLQIAVWASLPLGLMGGLQLLYSSAGGQLGQPGLAGLVDLIPGYLDMPEVAQQALTGLASHLTLFGLWSLLLLYLGARYGLSGRRITSLLVVTMWLVVIALTPVAFESLKSARRSARNPIADPLEMPSITEQSPIDDGQGNGITPSAVSTVGAPE